MKSSYFNIVLGVFVISLLSFSCSSNLDFNQVDNFKSEPVIVANLAYFDVPANEFVTNGIEQNPLLDTTKFEFLNSTFFRDNLVKADLFFEIDNTINRAYTLDLSLLDANNNFLYLIHFDVPAYAGVQNLVTKTLLFEGSTLGVLENTTKIAFSLTMLSGSPLTENSSGRIKLRSSITTYLVVQ